MKNLFDADAINDTIRRALASAGLSPAAGTIHSATETFWQALKSGSTSADAVPPASNATVIDVVARVLGVQQHQDFSAGHWTQPGDADARGTFETREFSNHAGARTYKLYIPARRPSAPPPLFVMLHGCTQSADDFAMGTQMNRLADEHGFLVVYPEQAAHANASKCWNWFKAQDQARDAGEASLIAGIAAEVAAQHGADPGRIFVAGLSAGAAMAVILGETYPELFAGVGAHSGLPYGSAHDIPSAMAAMKRGRSAGARLKGKPSVSSAPRKKALHAIPIIVFHGDQDQTVQAVNSAEIVQQAKDAHKAKAGTGTLSALTHRGTSAGGRSYSRTVHADPAAGAHIESWTLHGAGHAWSGGNAKGSFADGSGPDASSEMVRFFLALRRAVAA
ncbi:MAG: alpha/beta hydrolase family esterase [Burkholderiaceae bacterium]